MGLAVGELREGGREADAEVLAHISPARSSVVNYYGSITVDYEYELAQLDEKGRRPLRIAHRRPGGRAVGRIGPAAAHGGEAAPGPTVRTL
ncbi:hypothetical protein ACFC00_40300 [Streptomyces adustus]|uniref:hypothetical protein n=1 Tax=Streptomyces adustus TaxID=1609272 RepID=UPI0035D796F4